MFEARSVNLALDFCTRVGELLLSSGAGAADVTATMQNIAYHLGLRGADTDVTFTSLSMSYQRDPEEPPFVQLRQIKQREIDYDDLTEVDHLIRALLRDDVDLREARARLATITSTGHRRRRWAVTAGVGTMCGGVGLQLGGNPLVVAVAFVSAVLIDRVQLRMARARLPGFYLQVVGGLLASLLAVLTSYGSTLIDLGTIVPGQVVTANIVMLLAGIGFMGALQDALSGFYVTATARIMEAILATGGIIAGVSAGLVVGRMLGVEIDANRADAGSLVEVGSLVVGAAVAAAAFAYASYAPRRALAPIAAITAGATLLLAAVEAAGFGRAWAAGAAALGVGLVSYAVAGRFRVPPLVVVVPAIVPFLPGISIYRGLSLLSTEGESIAAGLLALITAASTALALAAGVILGEHVAQPVKREARRLEGRLAGPRLVGPLRTRASGDGRRVRTTRHRLPEEP